MRENPRLLLVVAPSKFECWHTARSFGFDFDKVDRMRFITVAHHLRGWSLGTPYVALDRARWPAELDIALHALTVSGRLRVASDRDIAALRSSRGAAE